LAGYNTMNIQNRQFSQYFKIGNKTDIVTYKNEVTRKLSNGIPCNSWLKKYFKSSQLSLFCILTSKQHTSPAIISTQLWRKNKLMQTWTYTVVMQHWGISKMEIYSRESTEIWHHHYIENMMKKESDNVNTTLIPLLPYHVPIGSIAFHFTVQLKNKTSCPLCRSLYNWSRCHSRCNKINFVVDKVAVSEKAKSEWIKISWHIVTKWVSML